MARRIKWLRNDEDGSMMSQGTRFLISKPKAIKAKCLVHNEQGTAMQPESRVRLMDSQKDVIYLCLSQEAAAALAEDIAAGRGVLHGMVSLNETRKET